MPALALVAREPSQVISPQSLDVHGIDAEIRSAAKNYKQSVMRLSYFIPRLRYHLIDDWSAVGVKDEAAYVESLGISQGTYFKYARIGTMLHALKLEDLQKITPINADLLTRVDPALILEFPWVREAQTLNSAQFCNLIIQRNRQLGSDKEPMAMFSIRVPFTAKKFLMETIEKFRQENNLKSAGEALELLVADVHDRPNVMTAVRRSHEYVRWARYRFHNMPKVKDSSEIHWLLRAERLLYKAYWAVRTDHGGDIHEEDAQTVYPAESSQDLQDFTEWERSMSEQPSGAGGEEAEDDDGVAGSERDLCAVRPADGIGGDEDSLEVQE